VAEPADALLSLYDAHVDQVYSYFHRRCGDRALAEELTSETFLSALRSLRRAQPQSADAAWLIGIARHKLVDHWRRRAREERTLHLAADADDEVDDPWDRQVDADRAAAVLDGLPAHYRLVLTLRYLDDLSVPEVAVLVDRTVHGTESLLVRSRRAFRDAYERAEGGRRGR
jgi:RNA polymerase sigma-70 factor (ECF subfamily)